LAEAQAAGGKPDSRDDWKPGARFVAPDPIASGKSGGDWLVDQPELPLDAGPFLATLRILGYHLQDRRYIELHRELIYSDLIDWKTGKWSSFGTTVANPFTQDMCGSIEESIAARGFTEREAIADAVAELELEAASFDAAYKRVERLLHAYRKFVVRRPA
jgi:hypothetical protein